MTIYDSVGLVLLGFVILSFILMFFFKKAVPRFKATFTFFLDALISFAIVNMSGIGYILFLYWALSILFATLGTVALVVEIIMLVIHKKKKQQSL